MTTIQTHLDANRTLYTLTGWLLALAGTFLAAGKIGMAILDMVQPSVQLF
jgi:hypothetical protein